MVLVMCWAMAGCAATDGGLLSGIKDRLRGKKDTADLAATASSASSADRAKSSDQIVAASANADQLSAPIGEVAESIIARVNGDVILAQDVLNPIRGQLAKAQQEMPASQFVQYRTTLIQQKLRDSIERQLLIQEAKRDLQEPIIKRMEAMADKEFGKRIEAEMKRMEVNTEAELRRKMLESGESLDQIREIQRGNFVAQQYLRMLLQPRLEVSREEMVDYYNLHREEFQEAGGVIWSEIVVNFEKCGSREAAHAKAIELLQKVRAGTPFSDIAKTESDGATAPNGGRWDLTAKGSYIVKAVDEAIFSLPPGKNSDPIEGPKGWHIVRVEDRKAGGEIKFVDAQDKIRAAIREQKIAKESQRYVQQLLGKAHITTVFDRPAQTKTAGSK
jgi:peptidyl-prolyl cis-trans isomerase SurA